MLMSKACPVTSPTSKAAEEHGTAHQGERSRLKAADRATPAVGPYLLPALRIPHPLPASSSPSSDNQTLFTGTKQTPQKHH